MTSFQEISDLSSREVSLEGAHGNLSLLLLLLPCLPSDLLHQPLWRHPSRHKLKGFDRHLANNFKTVNENPRGIHLLPVGVHLCY
jgi:hypothetical protein